MTGGRWSPEIDTLLESGREPGHRLGFLVEDEGGEQSDDFLGRVGREDVVEDELGEGEFITAVDLGRR